MKKKEDIFFATIYYLKINHKLIQQKILIKIHPLLSFSFMLQVKYHHKDSGPYFISMYMLRHNGHFKGLPHICLIFWVSKVILMTHNTKILIHLNSFEGWVQQCSTCSLGVLKKISLEYWSNCLNIMLIYLNRESREWGGTCFETPNAALGIHIFRWR